MIVRSYRTYEEWKHSIRILTNPLSIVLTVPMRNGNANGKATGTGETVGSYRTYEEWKHHPSKMAYNVQKVLTVPMRNGNTA